MYKMFCTPKRQSEEKKNVMRICSTAITERKTEKKKKINLFSVKPIFGRKKNFFLRKFLGYFSFLCYRDKFWVVFYSLMIEHFHRLTKKKKLQLNINYSYPNP